MGEYEQDVSGAATATATATAATTGLMHVERSMMLQTLLRSGFQWVVQPKDRDAGLVTGTTATTTTTTALGCEVHQQQRN
jgi:hypothetical protein